VALPDIHSDPFDRILIAEALKNKCRLVTKDETIPLYPDVGTVW
jgi:PIN domain nuclease of toxin-antitoxin system